MLALAKPEYYELTGHLRDADDPFVVRLRIFTLADIGWLAQQAGDDWWLRIATQGDTELAIKILAHQTANAGEIMQRLDCYDLEKAYREHIVAGGEQMMALSLALQEIYTRAVPSFKDKAKKKIRHQLRKISIGWLCAFCIGLATAGLWTIFWPSHPSKQLSLLPKPIANTGMNLPTIKERLEVMWINPSAKPVRSLQDLVSSNKN